MVQLLDRKYVLFLLGQVSISITSDRFPGDLPSHSSHFFFSSKISGTTLDNGGDVGHP